MHGERFDRPTKTTARIMDGHSTYARSYSSTSLSPVKRFREKFNSVIDSIREFHNVSNGTTVHIEPYPLPLKPRTNQRRQEEKQEQQLERTSKMEEDNYIDINDDEESPHVQLEVQNNGVSDENQILNSESESQSQNSLSQFLTFIQLKSNIMKPKVKKKGKWIKNSSIFQYRRHNSAYVQKRIRAFASTICLLFTTVPKLLWRFSLERKRIEIFIGVSLFLNMLIESLYPCVPRYNTTLAIFCFLLLPSTEKKNHRQQQSKQTRSFCLLFTLLLVISFLLDIDWIYSENYPSSSSIPFTDSSNIMMTADDFYDHNDNDNFYLFENNNSDKDLYKVQEKISLEIQYLRTWYLVTTCLFINILLKIYMIHSIWKTNPKGKLMKKRLWWNIHVCFPPLLLLMPSFLAGCCFINYCRRIFSSRNRNEKEARYPKDIQHNMTLRIHAILWVQFICASSLGLIGMIMHISRISQFQLPIESFFLRAYPYYIPPSLEVIVFWKTATSFTIFFVLLKLLCVGGWRRIVDWCCCCCITNINNDESSNENENENEKRDISVMNMVLGVRNNNHRETKGSMDLENMRRQQRQRLKLNKKHIIYATALKLTDLILGCILWIAIYDKSILATTTGITGEDFSMNNKKSKRIILSLLTVIQYITEIHVTLLLITVFVWHRILVYQTKNKSENNNHEEDYNDNDSFEDVSLGSSSLDASESAEEESLNLSNNNGTNYDLSNQVQKNQNAFEKRLINATSDSERSHFASLPPTIFSSSLSNQHNNSLLRGATAQNRSPARNLIRQHHYLARDNTKEKDDGENDVIMLDISVACTPQEFYEQWNKKKSKDFAQAKFSCDCRAVEGRIVQVPMMRDFHEYLEMYRYYVIASGVVSHNGDINDKRVDDEKEVRVNNTMTTKMKLYVVAQYEGIQCYMEFLYDLNSQLLEISFKSPNRYEGNKEGSSSPDNSESNKIAFFVKHLVQYPLGKIFDELITLRKCPRDSH